MGWREEGWTDVGENRVQCPKCGQSITKNSGLRGRTTHITGRKCMAAQLESRIRGGDKEPAPQEVAAPVVPLTPRQARESFKCVTCEKTISWEYRCVAPHKVGVESEGLCCPDCLSLYNAALHEGVDNLERPKLGTRRCTYKKRKGK